MEFRLPPICELELNVEYPYPKFHPDPDPDAPRPRNERLYKVLNYCKVLSGFAERYAAAPPSTDSPELAQMIEHAIEVTTILEDYKRAICPPTLPTPAPVRQPKRPWEDADTVPEPPANSSASASPSPLLLPSPPSQEARMHVFVGFVEHQPSMDDVVKAATDCDMEDISARRSEANANSTHGKVKYKKRSRASPPENCHSCEILDTPEWRRGPDGKRTLCNACGLHYAKLVRKRDRIISTLLEGVQAPPPIDIVYLRKSARLAAEHSAVNRTSSRHRTADSKGKPPKCDSSLGKRSADQMDLDPAVEVGRRGWGLHEIEEREAAAVLAGAPATPTHGSTLQHMSPPNHSVPMTHPSPGLAPALAHTNTLPSMRSLSPLYTNAHYTHPGYLPGPAPYARHGPAPSYTSMQTGYTYGYPPQQGPTMQPPGPPLQQGPWDCYHRCG